MDTSNPQLRVVFYRASSGAEPVRSWLRSLSDRWKKAIGEDIKTVQFGWPLGMPLVRKIESGLWEVRTKGPDGIARVLFTCEENLMVLVHGFIKKSGNTPLKELNTARARLKRLRS